MYISYEDFLSKGHKTTRGECNPPFNEVEG